VGVGVTGGMSNKLDVAGSIGVENYVRARTTGGLTLVPQSGVPALHVTNSGNVGVKRSDPSYALDVNGDVNVSGSYRVNGTPHSHPDYVFEPDYSLMPIDSLKQYIHENKHLPNVTSAEDVEKNGGYNLNELVIQMLEKLEEQTLYIIQLEDRIAKLEKSDKPDAHELSRNGGE
jgi:hypothetical protein